MGLLIISLAPVLIIAGYVYFRDKYEKEPIRLLLFALLAGSLTVLPILLVEMFLDSFTESLPGLLSPAWNAFVVAAFTEETFKFLALYLLIWKSPEFNEKFDGIVYAVFVSLGFAAVENVLYVIQGGIGIGAVRAITAVPAHAIFGVAMGFYFGMARFYEKEQFTLKIKALGYPIVLHGIYNFILMSGIVWLTGVFFLFVGFLYFFGLKRVKHLSNQSIYKTDYELLNQELSKPDQP